MTAADDLTAPFVSTVLHVAVAPGEFVAAGTILMMLESMKMEHPVEAAAPGRVDAVLVTPGDTVQAGDVLLRFRPTDVAPPRDDHGFATKAETAAHALDGAGHQVERALRPELVELQARVSATIDGGRVSATERRHARGRRTARENIEDLCDPGSFEEYGGLVVAAQRARRSREDLIANTPADGLVAGLARVNGDLFGPERSRCAVLSYDYSVLAGTQGQMNHRKKDRLFGSRRSSAPPGGPLRRGGRGTSR